MIQNADELYKSSQQYLPGGVCASARTNAVLGRPFYISHGDGAYIYDLEGHKFIDMCISHGASLLGHNHPKDLRSCRPGLKPWDYLLLRNSIPFNAG